MAKKPHSLDEAYSTIVSLWQERIAADATELSAMLADFRVQFSYNSGRIENPLITYHDTRDVFEDGRAVGFSGDVRTLFEIQNLKACHEHLLDNLKNGTAITEHMVREFHYTLTQGTYDEQRWAQGERPGEYKQRDYVVGISDTGAPAEDVPTLIRSLVKELDVATRENVLTVAAYFHLSLENIHPFADGNGRVGRALMNYLLLLHNHPPITIYDEDKLAYYGALETWDSKADLIPMKDFLKAETVKTWARLLP